MSRKVLCIDDSPTIRALVRKALEPEGYTVVDATDGRDGEDKADAGFALFLVDVNMPNLDGFGFSEAVSKRSELSSVPVVFLTTESGDDKKARGKELGVKGWIVKPFEPASLAKVVGMLTGT